MQILRNQEAKARNHVKRMHYKLAGVYKEVASGADPSRAEFNRFMQDLRAGEVAVFTSLSRVTREGTRTALEILRQLEVRGIQWHFIEQPFLNWDDGTPQMVKTILLTILAELDADYRKRISNATQGKYKMKKAAAEREGIPVKWGRPKGAKDKRPRKNRSPQSLVVGARAQNRDDIKVPLERRKR